MSHHHNHEHSHDHSHSHQHCEPGDISFEQKLVTILNHWIKHNDDHANTYLDWARKTAEEQHPEIEKFLKEAATATDTVSEKLKSALYSLNQR